MSSVPLNVWLVDDDASIRLVLSQAFGRLGYQVRATGNAATLLKWVSEGEGDASRRQHGDRDDGRGQRAEQAGRPASKDTKR